MRERLFADFIDTKASREEINLTEAVARARPQPLRDFDQINMKAGDLIMQTKLLAPRLAGQHVVFLGDGDCMSLMLGLFSANELIAPPERMIVLDFDKRLLRRINQFAAEHGFCHLVETCPYNVFEPLPAALAHRADWFYINPPYGSKNGGQSAQLWIGRCIELAKTEGSQGCLILPCDRSRRWSQVAMFNTQGFLNKNGFVVSEMLQQVHTYHLDDDNTLASSTVIVDQVNSPGSPWEWEGKWIPKVAAPKFYGDAVQSYPRYIEEDGEQSFAWPDDWEQASRN